MSAEIQRMINHIRNKAFAVSVDTAAVSWDYQGNSRPW
jgi:hypothetical protein